MPSWLFAQIQSYCSRHEPRAVVEARSTLFDGLSGEVLEIGAGTGVNFKYYPEGVSLPPAITART